MPRAQVFLLGAVWITILVIVHTVSFDVHETNVGDSRLFANFDEADFIDADEWTQDDLDVLKQMMDEHVSRFKAELERFDVAPRSRRSERGIYLTFVVCYKFKICEGLLLFCAETLTRTPTIKGTNRIPSIGLNSSASHLASQGSIDCFLWNSERFCVLGGTIFVFKAGKVEPFLSGLPVGPNDHVKVSPVCFVKKGANFYIFILPRATFTTT